MGGDAAAAAISKLVRSWRAAVRWYHGPASKQVPGRCQTSRAFHI